MIAIRRQQNCITRPQYIMLWMWFSAAGIVAVVSLFAEWPSLSRLDRRRVLEALAPKFEVRRLLGKRGRFAVDGVLFPTLALGSGNTDIAMRAEIQRLREELQLVKAA